MSSGKDQSVDLKLSPLSKKKLLESEAPRAIPEDTSDVGFGEDGMPLNPNGGEPQVQFTSPGRDPVNGDAKVEIGANVGVPHFVGLGKEELMKFANDPFWVRLRWILFALFWLIWLSMLVGAIIIIVLAPKCANTNQALTTGQSTVAKNGPYYEIFLKSFSPDGKLTGLKQKSQYLKDLGVKTVIISQFLDTNGNGISEVVDFEKIDPSYDFDFNKFKDLVKEFNDLGLKILLQFIPNHSSKSHKWFTEKPEYYVLRSKAELDNGNNNWKSLYDRAAWTAVDPNDPNTKYYLHQFHENEADFDFRNPDVVNEINRILEYWYSTGVDGFLLSDVSYLTEDLDNLGNQNSTKNQKDNLKIIQGIVNSKDWKLEGRDAPLVLLDLNDVPKEELFERYASGNLVPISADWATLPKNFNATDLRGASDSRHFVLRRLSSPRRQNFPPKTETEFGTKRNNILAMVSFLLRGEVVLYNGEESAIVEKDYYKDLIKLHHNLNQTVGDSDGGPTTFYTDPENEPGIFAFKREAAKNYAVITNVGSQVQKVNITNALAPPEKANLTVVSFTPGPTTAFTKGETISTDTISLDSESGIVLEILTAPAA